MRKEIIVFCATLLFPLVHSCSDNDKAATLQPDEPVAIRAFAATLGDLQTGAATVSRATSDYVVNQDGLDPTFTFVRPGWNLYVKIYKGKQYYTPGEGNFTYNTTTGEWNPVAGTTVYFPNYLTQQVAAKMTPPGWTGTISPDQSSAERLFAQDVLTQDGDTTTTVKPAHIPTIKMRHDNSMLDFILYDVTRSDIVSVNVVADNIQYQPYEVTGAGGIEFLVILPTGITNPEIVVETQAGARYRRVLDIDSTKANSCYCITLQGLELSLATIAVANWTYGEGIAADYSSVTSYPTFRGPANSWAILTFDNGLSQYISFNTRGEYTTKPVGRTVLQIETASETIVLNDPLVLRGMIIDLNPFISGN